MTKLSLCSCGILFLFCFKIRAQTSTSVSSETSVVPSSLQASAINFQVIESRRVKVGDHFDVYNRVAPPSLPLAQTAVISTPSPVQVEQSSGEISENVETLFLSATVYDHQVTLLQWYFNGQLYRAFSNIDFNYFTGVSEFVSANTRYFLIASITNETRAESGTAIPALNLFSPTQAEYIPIGSVADAVPDDSVAGIDALHVYFDVNKQALIAAYQQRQAAKAAAEAYAKAHPPGPPPDTVVNFWRVDTHTLSGSAGGKN